ncbi:MAG: beta-N-acetylhexosaminidase [Bacteroidia bacterium]|nr:beta-N-acetylhexosaminidase [Bacteroidia bacterium]
MFAMAMLPTELSDSGIIPKPVSVIPATGIFTLTEKSAIIVPDKSVELMQIGQYLVDKLNPATGFGMLVKSSTGAKSTGNIYLSLSPGDEQLGNEGYQLTINSDVVSLIANKPAGLFNGIQTIRQLFPARIEMASKQQGPWEIPAGTIRDYPEYSFRGVMLDVARHFFQVNDVKRYIDLMVAYKMNVMHLHLADDQGWRIEIKKWPKLTEIGGSTQVDGGKGGFYTQEQYTEIVKYAAERYIMIIPEIDMPGHTNAALASYSELNCNEKATELYTGIKVGFSTLCTGKEITYQFITDVFSEIAALTPGPFLHIGGDESHATKIEDYIPFVNRVQEIVSGLGKQVIGWDEIALSTLKPNTFVQFWAKADNALKGVKQGAKVIMSPAANAYLDMQYDATTKLGLHWAGYIEVDKGYNWDPATLVPGINKENILGIEAPLWSETITNIDELEYMVFPRLPGYAEIGWSASSTRNWDEYKTRLGRHDDRFKALQIDYYPSKLVPWSVPLER